MTKLVARETKNRQLFAILIRQGIQLIEVPDGRPSHCRDIIDEHDLAFKLSEVKFSAFRRSLPRATTEGFPFVVVQ